MWLRPHRMLPGRTVSWIALSRPVARMALLEPMAVLGRVAPLGRAVAPGPVVVLDWAALLGRAVALGPVALSGQTVALGLGMHQPLKVARTPA